MRSNANSNHSKGIGSVQMQILNIRKKFKAFKCKFKPFEWDSKHSNANSNHSKGIQSIRMQIRTIRKIFEVFECKFEPFERDSKRSNGNSNHSKGIHTIRMQIRTIQKGFEAFERKFVTIRNLLEAFECKFEPFEMNSKHSNANFNHSKGFRTILMQIRAIRK